VSKHTVNVQDAKTHLSRLLRRVEAGEEIAIARAGRVVARLVRAESDVRKLGTLEGQIAFADDAFEPMSAEEVELWHAGSIEP